MKRRAVLGGLAAMPVAVRAQSPARIYRLGGITPLPRTASHWVALFDELKRQGFVEGTNLEIVGFNIPPDRLDAVAADIAAHGVDAIMSGGIVPTRAAKQATTTIPILTAVDDFVAQNFVASLARPDGNITGVSIFGPELDGKRQETLLERVPAARRIAALIDPASTPNSEIDKLEAAARSRGASFFGFRINRQEEIGPAIDAARAQGAEAINVLASQLFNVNHLEILDRLDRTGLPAIYQWPEWVTEGGLLAYGPRFTTVYRQARGAAS